MADQDGMFGQLENLLSEQETRLLQENEQELDGEQEPETEENEEQEEDEEEEEEEEEEDENEDKHEHEHEQEHEQEQEQEQEQEKKQEKVNASAVVADRWPGWPGESVFRMLVPSQKVEGIIGRKGELIEKMCEEAKARIKILDGPAGSSERAVMVSAKEEPDLSKFFMCSSSSPFRDYGFFNIP